MRALLRPEEQANFIEIIRTSREVEPAVTEALADDAHGRAFLSTLTRYPTPRMLARANGFVLMPTSFSFVRHGDPFLNQVLVYPYRTDRRKQGYELYYALAHGLLTRTGIKYRQGDVCNLTLATMAPKPLIARLLRKRAGQDVARLIARRNPWAPITYLDIRVRLVIAALERANLLEKRSKPQANLKM